MCVFIFAELVFIGGPPPSLCPSHPQVKSFIETQRTLLAEIQNGCKRNFVLAKEKEESQQQMRQSVSMAEIATEDPPPEEEEVAGDQVSEEQKTKHEEEQEEEQQQQEEREKPSEVREDEEQTSVTQDDSDSDTDTDDDDNEDVGETKTAAQTSTLNQTPPPVNTTFSACQTPPTNTPRSTPETATVVSGIRVTEASVSSGTPSSPGRCFSVSSPGRGHKIFMVTRVESPPEQQQQQQQEKQQQSDLTKHVQENKTPSESSSKQQPVSQDQQSAERTTSAQETSEEPSRVSAESKPGEIEPSLSTTEEQPSTHSQTQQELNPSTETVRDESVHTEHAQIHHTAPAEPKDLFQDQLKPAEEVHRKPSSSNAVSGELQEQLTEHLDTGMPNDDQQLDKDTSLEQDLETVNSFSSAEEVESVDTAPPPGITLPNGLKPEFTLHLLEPEAHKAACCVMEHSEFTVFNIALLMQLF